MIIINNCLRTLANIVEFTIDRGGKIHTVKLKMEYRTVLRPVQPIDPLEIYSKESVDGELGGEESNSNNVSDNENKLIFTDAEIVKTIYILWKADENL
ncbi:hypothetical protein NPIL_106361 [Nephila pilipes]|uniref:Uncharacterized protein n=1 Tax=Nephila pilipes TaxID=299642 RepID=A0A8X6MXF6_NEPPI|nr:hypothetical protein NPIL_106361 [Nephila pilipes]